MPLLGWAAVISFGCFALIDLRAAVRALRPHHYGEMSMLLMNSAGLALMAGSFYWISIEFDAPPRAGFGLLFVGVCLTGLSETVRFWCAREQKKCGQKAKSPTEGS